MVNIAPLVKKETLVGGIVPLAIAVSVEASHFAPKGLVVLWVTALGSALLYLLPVFIWAAGGIPRYSTASLCAGALVVAVLFAGNRYLRHVTKSALFRDNLHY